MFSGHLVTIIDRRGRVHLPIAVRRSLGLGHGVLTVGLDGQLRLYPLGVYEELERRLLRANPGEHVRAMQRLVIGYATEVSPGGRGEIVVPLELREYANVTGSILLLGGKNHLEIWDENTWTLATNSPPGKRLDSPSVLQEDAPRVATVPAASQLLTLLAQTPELLLTLGAEELELLVCERFEKMGFNVARIGQSTTPDGGIDLIACPAASTPFRYLLAIQVKSHSAAKRKTSVQDVRDFHGALVGQPFRGGVIVTNTTFTPTARWFAQQQGHFIRLRDQTDLCRWLRDDFVANEPWQEIPATIALGPNLFVPVHDLLRDPRSTGRK